MIRLRSILALALALLAWLSATAARGTSMADGPGGPILVVTTTSNAFGNYYAEILRAEGLNEFAVTDITLVTPAVLNAYDVVILGQLALTTDQTTMFTNWVNGGGNLIAMRPDKKLTGLLGLTDASATLSNAYLRVYGTGAGAGIVTTPIQFHGVADRYNTNGATVLASLYADATTDMLQPAVTMRSVGTNGGHAAAFTFDLARSVVYTRQGNPAWAGQARDGLLPIRSADLFYGAASFDPQLDWVDLSRVAIPQADEQQRLLANLIGQINLDRKPLPRFWYFPKGKKAVVVMTSDQHDCGNGTRDRFQRYIALDPPGGSVADWDCVRASSYNFCYINMGDTEAKSWTDQGFELGIHLNTGCADWTPVQLESFFASQLASFAQQFPSLPGQVSHRTHCVVWSDWVTKAKVELTHGIRLDMDYYYYPSAWVSNRPGFYTGSGLPMRFADLDGTMIDVYQATTQMTDESGQSYPYTIDTLLDRALGPEGYYGAFGVNIHTDTTSPTQDVAIVSSARARGVPVVSGRQMLEWLDGRNGSSFTNITWSGGVLAFTVVAAPGARNLQAMVPTTVAGRALTGVSCGSSPVAYTAQTAKGIEYAFFSISNGIYQVSYTPRFVDTTLADFAAGTLDTNTCIAQTSDGEVILNPAVGTEFTDWILPAGWSTANWANGGSTIFAAGKLTIDGAIVGTTNSYTPGRSLEFVATFNAAASQHIGLAADLAFNAPWAIFSTFNSTTSLYARTSDGSSLLLPGNWLGAPHRFRIDWTSTNVVFTIDGTAVATNSAALMGNMRPVASDYAVGAPALSVDWIRMGPYASAGTFVSRVIDAGVPVNWSTLAWTSQLPDGTSLALSCRTGNTPAPDGSWTALIPVNISGGLLAGNSRYFQYVAQLSTTDPTQTPTLSDVEISYNFGADITPPAIIARSPAPGTTNVPSNASITLEFSEPMNVSTITSASIRLRRVGELIDIPATVTASGILATLTPLSPLIAGVSYQVTVAGMAADLSDNQLGSDVVWNFSTASVTANQIDTTIADFGAGLPDANSYIAQTVDGEVMLSPTLGTEFYGSTLPAGWSSANWASGGSVAVAGGSLTIDGAVAGTTASYGPGCALEFAARFNAAAFQHVGFAADLTFNAPWAIFSTSSTTNSLYARTSDGWNQLLTGNWLGISHRFRIDWTLTNVLFSIDGVLVATSPIALAGSMRPVASDFTVGGPNLAIDWERMSPYAAAGTFLSRVFDAGATVTWRSLTWTASKPSGTTVGLSYREGNTPAPDASWSGFTTSSASGAAIVGSSRYLQYRADLATADTKQTPVLQDVAVAWNLNPIVVVPAIVWGNPANIAYGTPLGPAQLNATASVPGTFTYSPPGGTVLSPGSNQTLSVSFVPSDPVNYTNASATVQINVLTSGSLVITANPQSQAVPLGHTVAFSVSAQGDAPLSYRWYYNGTNLLAGAASDTLTLTNVQPADAGSYNVVVTNVAGSVTSAVAVLTVWVAPGIVSQPQSRTNVVGTTASFSVSAGGTAPLSYQWQSNGTNLNGATSSSLVLANVQAGQAGSYSVVVTNVAGSVTSAVAVLTVWVAPGIVSQPQSRTNVVGTTASFSVSAGGTAPLSYQWQSNGTNLNGATSSSLVLANVQAAQAGSYSVEVTNVAGSATSGLATLTVWEAPVIVSGPTNQATVAGADVSFSALASGTAPLVYRWYFNGTNLLAEATTATLALTNVQPADAGGYSVVVTNVAGSVTSGVATLTLLVAPVIVSGPTNQATVAGADAGFSVLASGAPPLAYQWHFNGTNLLAGATSTALTLTNVQPADAGGYSVVVTNAMGSVTSGVAVLTVWVAPGIVSQPLSRTNLVGTTASFSISAGGTAPLSYQWYYNGSNLLAGATTNTFTLTNVQTTHAGGYSVVVTNVAGSVTSAAAALTVNVSLTTSATPGGAVYRTPDQPAYIPNSVVKLIAAPVLGWTFSGWSGSASGTANPLAITLTTSRSVTANFTSTVPDLIVDTPAATTTGTWTTTTATNDYGTNYKWASATSGVATATATFTPTIATAGNYDVYVWYPTLSSTRRSTAAPYLVSYNGGSTNVIVSQQSGQGAWHPIAAAKDFAVGTSGSVQLANNTGESSTRRVAADAVRWAYSASQNSAPVIIAQPQSLTNGAGTGAAFSVNVAGTAPLSYQWRFNGAIITGATTNVYVRENVQSADAGSYSVVVSNIAGAVISENAVLNLVAPGQPHLDAVLILPGGEIRLQGSGSLGHYAIDGTTNLMDWLELTNFTTTNDTFQYTDPQANLTHRFYRARLMP